MPTPPKSWSVLTSEKKSHRTKAELALRKQGEASLLSGVAMKESKEVREDPVAHKHWRQLKKLMKAIGKDDAIYEQSVNRYCIILSEELEMQKRMESLKDMLEDIEHQRDSIEPKDFFQMKITLQTQMTNLDKQIQAKRTMLNAMEKENAWTVSSAMRIIPKKQDKSTSALKAALGGE